MDPRSFMGGKTRSKSIHVPVDGPIMRASSLRRKSDTTSEAMLVAQVRVQGLGVACFSASVA
jgi:hypothetical protein